jgi:indole-3-glycerol phosphate synthase
MHNTISEIIYQKQNDLQERKKTSPFFKTIKKKKGTVIIGEIKLASPENSSLGKRKMIHRKIQAYEKEGVDIVSIITEEHFFRGDIQFIKKAKRISKLLVLQKDFVIDTLQIYEAKFAGSDALLLIARIVPEDVLREFVDLCFAIGIEPIVEVASEKDIKKAIQTRTRIIAVNARDLDTFTLNVNFACDLLQKIPVKYIKLGFSGIKSEKEMQKYKHAGVKGVLIGTYLMQSKSIKECIEKLHI